MVKHASDSRFAGKSKPFKTLIIFVDSEIDGLMFLIYSHSCLPQDQAMFARVNRTPEHGSASQSSDLRSPPTCCLDKGQGPGPAGLRQHLHSDRKSVVKGKSVS